MTKHLEKLLQGCERAAAAGNVHVSDMRPALCTHSVELAARVLEWVSLAVYLCHRVIRARFIPVRK